jgi:hypothetical protein
MVTDLRAATRWRGARRRVVAALTLCVGLFAAHCGGPGPESTESAPVAVAQTRPDIALPASERVPLYDLERDESQGGHTLARHVGRTDAELAERLRRERDISAASTYTDADTARRVVAQAVAQSHDRIESWASRSGNRPNLVLHYGDRGGEPIGRSLARGRRRTDPCTRALVVLRWSNRDGQWFVLTSYPEAS